MTREHQQEQHGQHGAETADHRADSLARGPRSWERLGLHPKGKPRSQFRQLGLEKKATVSVLGPRWHRLLAG